MNKETYCNSPVVIDFLSWFETIIDLPNSFSHSYISEESKRPWECDCIFSAYQKYSYSSTFDEAQALLTGLSSKLKAAVAQDDTKSCLEACGAVLAWGGDLRGNQERLEKLANKNKLCEYLNGVITLFNLDKNYNDYYSKEISSNSGFAKIYSLLLDNFIVYDSRVGAGLGLIVRKYCEAKELTEIPTELLFAWSKGETTTAINNDDDRRNPSSDDFHFPGVYNKPATHLNNNIRANWLLGKLANTTASSFKSIQNSSRLRAIEAALFMIGYDVKGN